jgi:hypothetical protein
VKVIAGDAIASEGEVATGTESAAGAEAATAGAPGAAADAIEIAGVAADGP